MVREEEFRWIMQNYDDDVDTPTVLDVETEEEREIAERMLVELWKHQQESQGGWYYKDYLFDEKYDNQDSQAYGLLQEKVYQRLVETGCIDVLESHPHRCAIGKNASVQFSIIY